MTGSSAQDGPDATPEKPSAGNRANYNVGVSYGSEIILYGAQWVALAMVSGVIGNLSYDALKSLRKRFVRHSSKELPASLQRDDALEIARAAVGIYCQSKNLNVDVDSATFYGPAIPTASGGWVLRMVKDRFSFTVTVPERGAMLGRAHVSATSFEWTKSEAAAREEIDRLRLGLSGHANLDPTRALEDRYRLALKLEDIGEFHAAAVEYEKFLAEAQKHINRGLEFSNVSLLPSDLKHAPQALKTCRHMANLLDHPTDHPVVRDKEVVGEIRELKVALATRHEWRIKAEAEHSSLASMHLEIENDLLLELADSYRSIGQYRNALPILEDLILTRLNESSSAYALVLEQELAECYQAVGRRDDALSIYKHILPQCELILGSGHPVTLCIRTELRSA